MNQVILILARWEGMITLRGTMDEVSDDCIIHLNPASRKPLMDFWPTPRDTAFLYLLEDGRPRFLMTTTVARFEPQGTWLRLAAPHDLAHVRPNPRARVSFELALAPRGSLLWRRARALDLSITEMTLVDRFPDAPGAPYSLRMPLLDGELAIECQVVKRQGALKEVQFFIDQPWQQERLLSHVSRMLLLQGDASQHLQGEPFMGEVDRIERLLKLMAHHPTLERALCPPQRQAKPTS